LQDRDAGVGVFPESEEIIVGNAGFGHVAGHRALAPPLRGLFVCHGLQVVLLIFGTGHTMNSQVETNLRRSPYEKLGLRPFFPPR
jgi:hypothetical protein